MSAPRLRSERGLHKREFLPPGFATAECGGLAATRGCPDRVFVFPSFGINLRKVELPRLQHLPDSCVLLTNLCLARPSSTESPPCRQAYFQNYSIGLFGWLFYIGCDLFKVAHILRTLSRTGFNAGTPVLIDTKHISLLYSWLARTTWAWFHNILIGLFAPSAPSTNSSLKRPIVIWSKNVMAADVVR